MLTKGNTLPFFFLTVGIDPLGTRWEAQFEKLKKFIERRGCFPYEIPYHDLEEEEKRLLEWTRRQKKQYRDSQNGETNARLSEERIAKLEEIGFSWNKNDYTWMERYQELVAYHELHGDSLVPTTYKANQKLADWVGDQRTLYRLLERGKSEWNKMESAHSDTPLTTCC